VSRLSRLGGPGGGRHAPVRSLFPLIALSLLVALLLTQNSVTLAYPAFQSPVESPIQPPPPTETPAVAPTEAPAQPPGETPAVPPAETPAVPPAETPAVAPGETPVPPPSGEETPTDAPEATPGEEAPSQEATPTTEGGEGSSPTRGLSPAVLIDTCVVGLSSVWMCCGGFALVVFLLLVLAAFLLRVS
jgi:outer membrane biosynthesis protein TonB